MQEGRDAREFTLDLFPCDNSLNLLDRGFARVPGGLRVVLAEIPCQFVQLDVGNISEMSSCMAGID